MSQHGAKSEIRMPNLSVDHRNAGRLDAHAGRHADVELLVEEDGPGERHNKKGTGVHITLPLGLVSLVLCVANENAGKKTAGIGAPNISN